MKLNKKQMILLGVGGVGLYLMLSKKEFKCPVNEKAYLVEGSMTCESKLNDLGYFMYNPGVDNREIGYYHATSWDTGFNYPLATKMQWIGVATNSVITQPAGSAVWTQALNLLDNYFVEGSQPLAGTY